MTSGWQAPPDPRKNDSPRPPMRWPPSPETVLTGSVVSLTQHTDDDAEPLFAALADDRVWRHLPFRPTSVAEQAEWLARMRSIGRVVWIIRLVTEHAGVAAGSVVGMSSYLNAAPHDARLEIGATAYAPAVWGTAVNAQTKLLLLEHAFEHLNVGRVQLVTDIRNVRSQRAMAAIGATFEGVLRRYQRRADGSVRDSVLFSVTAEDWPAVRTLLSGRLGQ
ncbi:GNAT family N-acetyltransferase [Actinophytocola sp.]|uniref:GNAT family N-acetyltransferase n=1 Tax=Actinophytocola sp. TaxID=1872138 RepID=UPI0038998F13